MECDYPSVEDSKRKFRVFEAADTVSPGHSESLAHLSPLVDTTRTNLSSKGADASDEHPANDQERQRVRRWVGNWWKEVVAAIVLAASVIATFATLAPYQGKPLPSWPYSLSVGTLLSAYSVVLRLSASFLLAQGLAQLKWRWLDKTSRPLHHLVLHDDATRGPMGALNFMFRISWSATWQWMGCVLVLLILLVGPFTQQVLLYEQCSVQSLGSKPASISRAGLFTGRGHHIGAAIHTLSVAEQSAISAGVYNGGSIGGVCDTGNCTFPPYMSVGYCSKCEDVSSQVKIFNYTHGGPSGYGDPSVRDWTTTITNWTNAHGPSLLVNFTWAASDQGPWQFATSMGINQSFNVLIGLPGSPFDPTNGQAPSGCNDPESKNEWRCRGFGAAACALKPCLRNYTAHVMNGDFKETIETTVTDVFGEPGLPTYYSTLNSSCLDNDQHDTLRSLNYSVNTGKPWLAYNIAGGIDPKPGFDYNSFELGLAKRGCIFGVDFQFGNGIDSYLPAMFPGNLTGAGGQEGGIIGPIIYFQGPSLLQAIYNYGNFSLEQTQAVFDNISLSLTNHMRNDPGTWYMASGNQSEDTFWAGLNGPVLGSTYTVKTCLRVQWPWLILPLFVVAATFIFFIGVILTSGRLPKDARSWKSSVLPLLFNALLSTDANEPDHSYAGSQRVEELNKVAEKTMVRLVRDDDGGLVLRRKGAIMARGSEL